MAKRWYVVQAHAGYEKQVQKALQERIKRAGMEDLFGRILVPVEKVVEMRSGQKTETERKFYPGYVLVEMEMNDDTWHLVRSLPKVSRFQRALKLRSPEIPAASSGGSSSPRLKASTQASGIPRACTALRTPHWPLPARVTELASPVSWAGGSGSLLVRLRLSLGGVICSLPALN